MKFLKKIFSIFLMSFLFASQLNSMEPIGYVDIDFIIKNSDIGKKTLEKINNLNQQNIDDLKNKEKILKDLEQQIANKKNVISKKVLDEEIVIFRKKVDEFKNDQKKIINDFNKFKEKEIQIIFKKISPIINSYMEKNSLKILFDAKNIFMARNDLNLTEDILKEINQEIK